mgnify:FL=1
MEIFVFACDERDDIFESWFIELAGGDVDAETVDGSADDFDWIGRVLLLR